MDELEVSQGSEQSPSILDGINSHLSGDGAQPETPVETTEAVEAETPETVEEEPARADERITQLVQEREQERRQREQLELMIAANPQMRAEYERLVYGQQVEQPPQLPDWDPYDPEVIEAHKKAMKEELMQEFAPFIQFVQAQQQSQLEARKQEVVGHIDNLVFQEYPEAKENPLAFKVVNQNLIDELAKLPPEIQQARQYFPQLNPQQQAIVKNAMEQAARNAVAQAKLDLQGFQQAPAPAPPPKVFSEGGTNLVQQKANEPTDVNSMILAHLNKPT